MKHTDWAREFVATIVQDAIERGATYKDDQEIVKNYQQLINDKIKEARIDELKLLEKTRWTDIAYDISGYLRNRIKQLSEDN